MRIGILGSGLMGGKLGTLFARAGHDVVFSYARSEQKLKRLAREAQRNAWRQTHSEICVSRRRLCRDRQDNGDQESARRRLRHEPGVTPVTF